MKQRPAGRPSSSEQIIRDIKRKTRKQYNAEEKIRIVLDGLRGEDSCADEKALPKVFITSGPRTLWKPARSAWPAIPRLIEKRIGQRRCCRTRCIGKLSG